MNTRKGYIITFPEEDEPDQQQLTPRSPPPKSSVGRHSTQSSLLQQRRNVLKLEKQRVSDLNQIFRSPQIQREVFTLSTSESYQRLSTLPHSNLNKNSVAFNYQIKQPSIKWYDKENQPMQSNSKKSFYNRLEIDIQKRQKQIVKQQPNHKQLQYLPYNSKQQTYFKDKQSQNNL